MSTDTKPPIAPPALPRVIQTPLGPMTLPQTPLDWITLVGEFIASIWLYRAGETAASVALFGVFLGQLKLTGTATMIATSMFLAAERTVHNGHAIDNLRHTIENAPPTVIVQDVPPPQPPS